MSLRQQNLGSIIKPGFNPLTAPTPTAYSYWMNAWGNGTSGQLGLGNTADYSSPKQVGLLTDWSSMSAGGQFVMAIKTNGTLWAWGYNVYGQLGTNNRTTYSSPVQVGALTTWLQVACGYGFVTAIKTDGTLWAWGNNDYGQLGYAPAAANKSSPTQVGALTNWLSVASGRDAAAAVKTDGTMWSWGRNDKGQLGIGIAGGTTTYRSSPTQVGALTNWLKVSSGEYNFATIKTDGTLWTWGYNNAGQLGDGSNINRSSPVQVGLLTDWSTPVNGSNFGTAVKTNGTLWSWGRNNFGQLGNGNTTYYSSPRQIGALTTWSTNGSGGAAYCIFVRTDGTMWSWGSGGNYKLGLGNTTNYSSPKQVGTGVTWYKVATGNNFAVGMKY